MPDFHFGKVQAPKPLSTRPHAANPDDTDTNAKALITQGLGFRFVTDVPTKNGLIYLELNYFLCLCPGIRLL